MYAKQVAKHRPKVVASLGSLKTCPLVSHDPLAPERLDHQIQSDLPFFIIRNLSDRRRFYPVILAFVDRVQKNGCRSSGCWNDQKMCQVVAAGRKEVKVMESNEELLSPFTHLYHLRAAVMKRARVGHIDCNYRQYSLAKTT